MNFFGIVLRLVAWDGTGLDGVVFRFSVGLWERRHHGEIYFHDDDSYDFGNGRKLRMNRHVQVTSRLVDILSGVRQPKSTPFLNVCAVYGNHARPGFEETVWETRNLTERCVARC